MFNEQLVKNRDVLNTPFSMKKIGRHLGKHSSFEKLTHFEMSLSNVVICQKINYTQLKFKMVTNGVLPSRWRSIVIGHIER